MIVYVHKDCGQPAVEMRDIDSVGVPRGFPFTCLSCLEEIEDESDLAAIEQIGQ